MRRAALLLRIRCRLTHPLRSTYQSGLCRDCHLHALGRGRL